METSWNVCSHETKERTPPSEVPAKPRLRRDLDSLQKLCLSEKPPWRRVRPVRSASVFCGFGDASGAAFGATLQRHQSSGALPVLFECGQWLASVTAGESSNWRELTNLVVFLESRARLGELDMAEIFLFTDDTTAENAFWKGSSKSKKLLDLVLRLRQMEMATGLILHIIHVSGTRMIAQGTDGLSRGDHSSGVMQEKHMLNCAPLHLSAVERSRPLVRWLGDVLPHQSHFTILQPNDWFDNLIGKGPWVWCPAPAAADVVVERLRIARHKRPDSFHLVVVPRLMTGRWRKQLGKASDCHF